MALLVESSRIGKYKVQNLIKANLYTETYRVVDTDNNPYFLKIFAANRLPEKLVNAKTGLVREIEFSQKLQHSNIISFVESGSIELNIGTCQYYISHYYPGSILSEYVMRKGHLSEDEALKIFIPLLQALKFMHSLSPVLCHNDIVPSNIILTQRSEGEVPILIDLGHVSERCAGRVNFDTSDIDLLYHANENRVSMYDEQSDIFSLCAVLYFMLAGKAPWNIDLDDTLEFEERFKQLSEYRKKNKLQLSELGCSAKVAHVLETGLELNSFKRVGDIDAILKYLSSETATDNEDLKSGEGTTSKTKKSEDSSQSQSPNYVEFEIKKGTGNGFRDIAGMQPLKDYLTQKVIFVITNKELVAQYKLTPPNGMLLYGPPGCGKTFFAEKFAEETGFNFMLIKSSDLSSSFVHGGQEKIGFLFKQAEQNAPIVLCFDEFDALVPDRSQPGSSYVSSEVNEFLSQMNNCSQRGIFIVATSNRPDKIDPAVLRTGRVDKMVYVPLPDFEARKEMFKLHLNGRPLKDDINYDELAQLTEGYIASDITYIVNDAAMAAAFNRLPISHELLLATVRTTRPSLHSSSIEMYERMREKIESNDRRNLAERPSVGFKP